MVDAIALARNALSDIDLRWLVYGDALIPPNNDIAPYKPLGFLAQGALANAYARADALLSSSWYESFPLFPLEAMASGLPVITTPYGTEEYAVDGVTAEVVEPRNPGALAAAIARLVRDPARRLSMAQAGYDKSKEFTWERSVATMERILTRGLKA